MGCALPAGLKQGPACQAAMNAGIPVSTGATTIDKLCGSGMKATVLAHDLIKAGTNDVMIAGGMESMTDSPCLVAEARGGFRMGHGNRVSETVPVGVKARKGESTVMHAEQPGNAEIQKIPTLKPAFKEAGTVTAANYSSISDGASALVLTSEESARDKRVKPLARIVGHATHSRHPAEFTIAPIGAVNKLLNKVGWGMGDVDLFEVNEAFAMVTMPAIKELNLDPDKVNIHGGACAQGHPMGSTGDV